MNTVPSRDGTVIAFEVTGEGPPLVLVGGGFSSRKDPVFAQLAVLLAPTFTVYNYDRRGRGDSGDTQPYEVQREVEDLEAVVTQADGSPYIFGGSSGAALALKAVAQGLKVRRLAIFEPPYIVDGSRPPQPSREDFDELLASGRRGEAVELFMTAGAGVSTDELNEMRQAPFWPSLEAVAHTLAYEAAIMVGGEFPIDQISYIDVPTIVLAGSESPAWLRQSAQKVAETLVEARLELLAGQSHGPSPESIAEALNRFFAQ